MGYTQKACLITPLLAHAPDVHLVPDKLTLAAYNSTSNNSSRSPPGLAEGLGARHCTSSNCRCNYEGKNLATRTESIKFQCMEGLDQDQKYRPSTVARSISSTVKRRLKIEFRMRKVNGSGEPICSTVQWASTPIMTAQTRISIAQPSSNFGCATSTSLTGQNMKSPPRLITNTLQSGCHHPGESLAPLSSRSIKLPLLHLLAASWSGP